MWMALVWQVFGHKLKYWTKTSETFWPDDGDSWKVKWSQKLLQFILRQTWMSEWNFMAIYPIVYIRGSQPFASWAPPKLVHCSWAPPLQFLGEMSDKHGLKSSSICARLRYFVLSAVISENPASHKYADVKGRRISKVTSQSWEYSCINAAQNDDRGQEVSGVTSQHQAPMQDYQGGPPYYSMWRRRNVHE